MRFARLFLVQCKWYCLGLLRSHFIDDLRADSLDIVDLVMGIEEEFDLTIEDEHAERILTVQNAVDYILEHTS